MIAAAPVATNDHDRAVGYGTQALRLWAQGGTVHSRTHDCILCADGRAYLRADPLRGRPPETEMERVARRGGG